MADFNPDLTAYQRYGTVTRYAIVTAPDGTEARYPIEEMYHNACIIKTPPEGSKVRIVEIQEAESWPVIDRIAKENNGHSLDILAREQERRGEVPKTENCGG